MCVEVWYPCRLRCGAMFSVFNRKIASCYDTMGLFVDSKNKMASAREKLESHQKEGLSIVQVNDEDTKKQINDYLTKLVSCLGHYVQRCN